MHAKDANINAMAHVKMDVLVADTVAGDHAKIHVLEVVVIVVTDKIMSLGMCQNWHILNYRIKK